MPTSKHDGLRCNEQVRSPGLWPRFHQCTRPANKDGKCKIHHPDAVAARRAKSDAAWEEKHKNAMAPYHKAKELERENATLRELLFALANIAGPWVYALGRDGELAAADELRAILARIAALKTGGRNEHNANGAG